MTSFDLIASGPQAQDDITIAASQLQSSLEQTFLPLVEQAQGMHHEIPADPVALGLAQFNQRLSIIRADANRVAQWLQQAIVAKRQAQDRVKAAKVAFDHRKHNLMTHDPTVKEAPGGQAGRETMARQRMERETRIVAYAERIYTQVLGYHEALKLAHDNLAATKRDMMDQLNVIREQIKIGEISGGTFPVSSAPSPNHHRSVEERVMQELGTDAGNTNF